ncbi:MAG: hypothetical protein HKN82_19390 [Akkermansiaceae bacterium]|nr:hypothetical protein [Akkermansiaceae bacterium]NNM30132.1 hypothetical protein [Akkermansiaceae bacterium]
MISLLPLPRCWWALLLALAILPVSGTAIQWNSALFGTTDADSNGTPLNDSWSFYLGAFVNAPGGWSPGPSNTHEWHAYWVTADVSGYFPPGVTAGRFSSRHEVSGLIPIFSQGFIWGTNRACPNGEWILMTNPSLWYWPQQNDLDPTTSFWEVDGDTVAIVGAVQQGGFQMQTAAVLNSLPPLLSGENWREIHFTPSEIQDEEATVSGWMADPNRNGRSNLLEFAYNTDPRVAQFVNQPAGGMMEVEGNKHLTLTVAKDPNVAIIYTGEVGSDLQTWFSDSGNVVLESAAPKELVFRDLTPVGSGLPCHVLRVRVSLP